MRVSDLLLERLRSFFVGREEQLNLLARTVNSPEWQLLNIYGPGGIGKTTLLRMFAQTLDPAHRIYLDGYSGFRSPEDFSQKYAWSYLHILKIHQHDPVMSNPLLPYITHMLTLIFSMLTLYVTSRELCSLWIRLNNMVQSRDGFVIIF